MIKNKLLNIYNSIKLFRSLRVIAYSLVIFTLVIALIFTISNDAKRIVLNSFINYKIANKNISVEIGKDSKIGLKKFYAHNVKIKMFNTIITFPTLSVYSDFKKFSKKGKINIHIEAPSVFLSEVNTTVSLSFKGGVNLFSGQVKGDCLIASTSGEWLKNNNFNSIDFSTSFIYNKNDTKINNLEIILNKQAKLALNGSIEYGHWNNPRNISLQGSANDVPLNLYEVLIPEGHYIKEFFKYYIKNGLIKNGDFLISLGNNFFEKKRSLFGSKEVTTLSNNNVSGKLAIEGLTFKYSDYMPNIDDVSCVLNLSGSKLYIQTNHGMISGNKVNKAKIEYDWLSSDKKVIADATTEGDAAGLTHFVPPEVLSKLMNTNINITALKGVANTNIHLEIPTLKLNDSKYVISTNINDLQGDIIKDRLSVNKMKMQGTFDGNNIILNGIGYINHYPSDVKIIVNLDEKNEFSQVIEGKLLLTPIDKKDASFEVINGKVPLFFSYKVRKNEANFSAWSDLTKLHFIINPISLNKPHGEIAKLKVDGKIIEGSDQSFSFNLSGDDNLKILGNIHTNKLGTKFVLDKVNYYNNNFTTNLEITNNKIKANINGGLMDLEKMDFSKFFSNKNMSYKNIDLKIHLDEIKLQNKVTMNNFFLDMECNNNKCKNARLFSDINKNKMFRLELLNSKNPQWNISTSDAGSLFKGLGINNKINNGELLLVLKLMNEKSDFDFKNVHGNFTLNNFSSAKSKFLARMVSFISIQGLVPALLKADIPFSVLAGEFNSNDHSYLLSNIAAEGPYFSFTAKGKIETIEKFTELKGSITPSIWGLNSIVGSLPIFKALVGKRKGILVAPFSIKENYGNK